MFTTGLKEFKKVIKKTKTTIVQYIIAILLRSALLDNKEPESLEKHYGFRQEDITKEIQRIFTN